MFKVNNNQAPQSAYDAETMNAINNYGMLHDQIMSASHSAGNAQSSVQAFLSLCDQAIDVKTQAERVLSITATTISNNPYSRAQEHVSVRNQKAMTGLESAKQIMTDSLAAARQSIPHLTKSIWLAVMAIPPYPNTGAVVAECDSLKTAFYQALLSASDKQKQAETIMQACVDQQENNGLYMLLNGPMDVSLASLGVDLVALHKAYVASLNASGQQVKSRLFVAKYDSGIPNQAIVDCVSQDAFTHLCNLAETAATRVIAVVASDVKKRVQ